MGLLLTGAGASTSARDTVAHPFRQALRGLSRDACKAVSMPVDEAVHRLRLVIKRLRALLRLMPRHRPKTPVTSWDSALRQISRRLAPFRDRHVRRDLLRHIVGKHFHEGKWMGRMTTSLDALPSAQPIVRDMASRLSELISDVTARHRNPPDFESCEKGLRRSWRRVRRYREAAVRAGAIEDFHGWRRWQKRMESQCRFMGVSVQRGGAFSLRDLHRLQEVIGNLHDADQLLEWLRNQRRSRQAKRHPPDSLLRRVKRLKRRLRRQVIRDSRRVFKGPLRAFFKHGPTLGFLLSQSGRQRVGPRSLARSPSPAAAAVR